MKLIAAAALTIGLALAGCSPPSTGVQIRAEQLSDFQKGKTTYQEVISRLGPPSNTMISSDGKKTISYFYSKTNVDPKAFIPIVGTLMAGGETHSNSVELEFSKEGILTDYTASEGHQKF
ncbi:hypothetical protein [Magnetospirillum fulvum]|uniref:Lipoprotein SmpA/OmlA domain-containing protein n=1 Tax=Magnetospirillum fulvum TaxID=1082 RepID=A0A1H6HGG2_MAGFU|nr:hypothetical protein [Magnetospirillum fulvum]SEH34192.1 hypothetical protein SAMN04244559_01555 [Magnetospirillum fulvum]